MLVSVGRKVGPGDKSGVVGNQESDQSGDLLWPTQSSDRDLGDNLLAYIGGDRHDPIGGNVTR